MKQPKTVEEFMALPIRELFTSDEVKITPENRASLEARVGCKLMGHVIKFPRMRTAQIIAMDNDTIFYCRGYLLHCDEEGLCRREARL